MLLVSLNGFSRGIVDLSSAHHRWRATRPAAAALSHPYHLEHEDKYVQLTLLLRDGDYTHIYLAIILMAQSQARMCSRAAPLGCGENQQRNRSAKHVAAQIIGRSLAGRLIDSTGTKIRSIHGQVNRRSYVRSCAVAGPEITSHEHDNQRSSCTSRSLDAINGLLEHQSKLERRPQVCNCKSSRSLQL